MQQFKVPTYPLWLQQIGYDTHPQTLQQFQTHTHPTLPNPQKTTPPFIADFSENVKKCQNIPKNGKIYVCRLQPK